MRKRLALLLLLTVGVALMRVSAPTPNFIEKLPSFFEQYFAKAFGNMGIINTMFIQRPGRVSIQFLT